MATNPFMDWLPEVMADEVLSAPLDIEAEARTNLWAFTLTPEQAATLSPAAIESFVDAVTGARSRQLEARNLPPMLFYCWHDEQAGQLRFCLVSERHGRLPFGCEVEQVANLHAIAVSFLQLPHHGGIIPWSEISEDNVAEQPADRIVLQVWVTRLPRTTDANSE